MLLNKVVRYTSRLIKMHSELCSTFVEARNYLRSRFFIITPKNVSKLWSSHQIMLSEAGVVTRISILRSKSTWYLGTYPMLHNLINSTDVGRSWSINQDVTLLFWAGGSNACLDGCFLSVWRSKPLRKDEWLFSGKISLINPPFFKSPGRTAACWPAAVPACF